MSKRQLRGWQREAFDLYIQNLSEGQKTMLWEATPGAGKTTAALNVISHQLSKGLAQKALVVVPTSHLRIQWAYAAAGFGIQLDSNFGSNGSSLTSDFHGAIVTYQQFRNNQRDFSALAKKSVVILDEVHHTGEGLTWGEAVQKTLAHARFILSLSGTAFRSDNNPIPFVSYDKTGISTPDFTYSYSNAVEDKVCRPTAMFTFGGDVSWVEGEKVYKAGFSDNLDFIASSRRLRAALEPDAGWIKPMIKAANEMLLALRAEHKDAGALMVCSDQKHARKMASIIAEISSEKPTLVLSDDAAASKKIKKFASGSSLWIVACNMVSEGVDIPRLRVGVYGTTIKTKMYFRQFLGRIVRRTPEPVGHQVAYLYLPADPALRRLAEEVETEIRHCLNAPQNELFDQDLDRERKNLERTEKSWTPLEAFNSGVDSVIIHGNQLTLFGLNQPSDLKAAIQNEVQLQHDQRLSRSEAKAKITSDIRLLVGSYHKKSGKPHSLIHTLLNKAQSVGSQTACTLAQLQQRAALIQKMIDECDAASGLRL